MDGFRFRMSSLIEEYVQGFDSWFLLWKKIFKDLCYKIVDEPDQIKLKMVYNNKEIIENNIDIARNNCAYGSGQQDAKRLCYKLINDNKEKALEEIYNIDSNNIYLELAWLVKMKNEQTSADMIQIYINACAQLEIIINPRV